MSYSSPMCPKLVFKCNDGWLGLVVSFCSLHYMTGKRVLNPSHNKVWDTATAFNWSRLGKTRHHWKWSVKINRIVCPQLWDVHTGSPVQSCKFKSQKVKVSMSFLYGGHKQHVFPDILQVFSQVYIAQLFFFFLKTHADRLWGHTLVAPNLSYEHPPVYFTTRYSHPPAGHVWASSPAPFSTKSLAHRALIVPHHTNLPICAAGHNNYIGLKWLITLVVVCVNSPLDVTLQDVENVK